MIKEALHKVINNEDLTYEEALETMKEIMTWKKYLEKHPKRCLPV